MWLSISFGFILLVANAVLGATEQHRLGLFGSHSDTLRSTQPSSSDVVSGASPWRESLLALHKSLVDIESITGNENAVGRFLVDYLANRGYIVQLEFLPPRENTGQGKERFDILAWPGPSRKPKPRVLVTSHIDVVPPYIPYSISDDQPTPNTTIRGRGSVDAKASIATQITALEELRTSREVAGADVMLLYVVGEEVSGDGMRFFSKTLQELDPPPDFEAVIFGEPTENKLACGHKGHMICTLSAKGKAGHSGYPWLGKSATEILIRSLVKVLDTDLGSSDMFGNTTVNVGVINGGVAANVIPETASARLAIRVATGPQKSGHDIVRERIQKILEDIDEDSLSMECENGYGVVECNCDVDGFDSIFVNYGTDVPNLEGKHTRYLYGPGDILVAHSDHEQLKVQDLETAVDGYKKLIKYALGK